MAAPATPSSNGVATKSYPTIDPILVVEHLAHVLEVTLSATRKELESYGSLLSKSKYSDTIARCTQFATEPRVALYARKDIVSDAEDRLNDVANGTSTTISL